MNLDSFRRLIDEMERARAKFPGNRMLLTALAEEVGELAEAIATGTGVRTEALHVACVAVRILEEGTRGDSGAIMRACRELEAQAREELARAARDAALDAGPACGEG